MEKYKIVEAHWSKFKESHTLNDPDSTYAVLDEKKQLIALFTKREDAEKFVKNNFKI